MRQVAAQIAYRFKSKLIIFFTKKYTAKKPAEKILEKQNQEQNLLHHSAWSATQVAQLKKKLEKKQLVESYSTSFEEKLSKK